MSPVVDPTSAVLAIALFFLGFYVVGSIFGRRRVANIAFSVTKAVDALGGKYVGGRSGVSAAVLSFREMGHITEFSVVIGITTWANPLSYLISKMMKRKDLIIIRGKMKNPPTHAVTFIRKGSPAMRYARRWGEFVADLGEYMVFSSEKDLPVSFARAIADALNDVRRIFLLSLNTELPHVVAYSPPGGFEEIKTLLSILRKLI
ncbi:MAG: hypothetical protein NZ581_04430 [Candidatus Caldarchaeum sp.]|nr:hypothetical protein [Candidatus Caldarchaeum sp.]MDW8435427.1 hypothetical protein [Candidatus Caldarchaeum sp.]